MMGILAAMAVLVWAIGIAFVVAFFAGASVEQAR